MGGRAMPVECPHGAIIDWGDFGQDPDDGIIGAEECAKCDHDALQGEAIDGLTPDWCLTPPGRVWDDEAHLWVEAAPK